MNTTTFEFLDLWIGLLKINRLLGGMDRCDDHNLKEIKLIVKNLISEYEHVAIERVKKYSDAEAASLQ